MLTERRVAGAKLGRAAEALPGVRIAGGARGRSGRRALHRRPDLSGAAQGGDQAFRLAPRARHSGARRQARRAAGGSRLGAHAGRSVRARGRRSSRRSSAWARSRRRNCTRPSPRQRTRRCRAFSMRSASATSARRRRSRSRSTSATSAALRDASARRRSSACPTSVRSWRRNVRAYFRRPRESRRSSSACWRAASTGRRSAAGCRRAGIGRQDLRADRHAGQHDARGGAGSHRRSAAARSSGSVSKKTDYLVAGADAGSKLTKAAGSRRRGAR